MRTSALLDTANQVTSLTDRIGKWMWAFLVLAFGLGVAVNDIYRRLSDVESKQIAQTQKDAEIIKAFTELTTSVKLLNQENQQQWDAIKRQKGQ